MTTLKEIKDDLQRVAHASQLKTTVAMLIGYLEQAGVQTPDEKEATVNEQRHREVAEAQTVQALDAVVEGWGADFRPDADLERAVDERDAYLREQAQADEGTGEVSGAAGDESAGIETGDYTSWDKTRLVNQARVRELPVSGTKDELAARLAKDDERRQAEADAAASASTGETPGADESANTQP